MKQYLGAIAVLGMVTSSMAAVTQVGVFDGALDDNFDSYTVEPVGPVFNFLGGIATNTSAGAQDIFISNGHGLGGSKAPYFSSNAMVANNGNGSTWTITFSTLMSRIGGYWQSAFDDSYLKFEFFDSGDNATGTFQVTPPNTGQLTWYGFEDAGGIAKVIVTSDQAYQIVDDFTADVVPEPASIAALSMGAIALLRRRKR